jgi:hypothetical protein
MGMFDEAKQQAGKAAKDHPDQVEKASDQALQRGGDAADKASGGKYGDKIDKGEQAADQRIGE